MKDDNNDENLIPEQKIRKTHTEEVPEEIRKQIIDLHTKGYGTRKICPRVGCSRKIVRRVLREEGLLEISPREATKLVGFEAAIEERLKQGLTVTRILREIRALGYTGGRTILAELVQVLKTQHAIETSKKKKVTTRFETQPGEESQIDWSPYRVVIAGRLVFVKALGFLLCWSRKLFLHFFDNERQNTLLEGLAMAFEYFDGSSIRVVLDNMATAIVARYGPNGRPIFQQPFLDFANHYGFTPFPCHVQDPNRKGKKEKSFRLVETDFLRGAEFESLDDLNRRAKIWLDQTTDCANLRIHGTTHRVPNEAYLSERDFLIRLPEKRFPVYESAVRIVDADSTLSVRGNRYSIPAHLANRSVAVHLFAEHFEVLDRDQKIAFSRRYVDDANKGPPVIDPTHYQSLKRRHRQSGQRLHEAFLLRFPKLEPLVTGLFEKMKSLTPVHLRALLRLADQYGEEAFVTAAIRAQEFRRFDARAVERILEKEHGAQELTADPPLGGVGPSRIGEVESGSLDDYSHLDRRDTKTSEDEPNGGEE